MYQTISHNMFLPLWLVLMCNQGSAVYIVELKQTYYVCTRVNTTPKLHYTSRNIPIDTTTIILAIFTPLTPSYPPMHQSLSPNLTLANELAASLS